MFIIFLNSLNHGIITWAVEKVNSNLKKKNSLRVNNMLKVK